MVSREDLQDRILNVASRLRRRKSQYIQYKGTDAYNNMLESDRRRIAYLKRAIEWMDENEYKTVQVCQNCGKIFKNPSSPNLKVCSDDCYADREVRRYIKRHQEWYNTSSGHTAMFAKAAVCGNLNRR